MFSVYFDGTERPVHSDGSYRTFEQAVAYVNGWLSNIKKQVPNDWDGKPLTFIEGHTIEIRQEST